MPRKTTWSVNENAPAAYRTSQLQQQSFCQEVYRRHGQPPEFMELAWTEEGDGELEYFQSGELTSASGVRLQRGEWCSAGSKTSACNRGCKHSLLCAMHAP